MGFLRAAVVLVALGQTALAQPGPNERQRTQAGDLVKKAIAKSQGGDHATAIELYLQAYQIAPLPILLSNIATEFQQEGKPVDALKYFCWYLKDDPTGANVNYATTNVKALQIQLGREIDEKDVCHPVEHKTVEPTPTPAPPTPKPAPEPPIPAPMPPGPPPEPADARSTLQISGMAVGGAGIVAFGVGVYFGVAGYQLSNKISGHCPSTPCTNAWESNIRDEENEGNSDNTKQIAFMVAGGIATAAGVALYVVGRHKREESPQQPVMLVPTGSPTSVGLALTGGF
jgi:hypothetical protein